MRKLSLRWGEFFRGKAWLVAKPESNLCLLTQSWAFFPQHTKTSTFLVGSNPVRGGLFAWPLLGNCSFVFLKVLGWDVQIMKSVILSLGSQSMIHSNFGVVTFLFNLWTNYFPPQLTLSIHTKNIPPNIYSFIHLVIHYLFYLFMFYLYLHLFNKHLYITSHLLICS